MIKDLVITIFKTCRTILFISIIPTRYFYDKHNREIIMLILKERGYIK